MRWTRDRVAKEARLVQGSGLFPDVVTEGRQLSYEGFLASEQLANLRDLALSIQTQIPLVESFIAAPALELAHTDAAKEHSDAGRLVLERCIDPKALPFGSTRVLFIHGNAGAGKTALLRHVTRLHAEEYLRGRTTTLLLYLDAQGKGLAQLEDVMARALQDLRARFTYHCLAPLTRRRCVVPIVDGFDELIGPSSAREAFGNLAQFLSQLDCEGAVIASSRSAFIDYDTLHARATEIAEAQGLSYEIYPLELIPWSNRTVLQLASERLRTSAGGVAKIEALLTSPSGDLVRKPFFLSHVCSILSEGGTVEGDKDLVRQVVDAALAREASKLKRAAPLLTVEQHREFCQQMADEMWWQERADLDCQTVRTIAEMFAEDAALAPSDAKMLVDRSIAHGLLVVTPGDTERRAFEHEVFRFEFQASRLASVLLEPDGDMRDYVLRHELAAELVDRISAHGVFGGEEVLRVTRALGDLAKRSKSSPHGASNAGTLAIAVLRIPREVPAGGQLESLYMRATEAGRLELRNWRIRDCVFEQVDMQDVRWIDCSLEGSTFIGCTLSGSTRLDGTNVSPSAFAGIRWGDRESFDPNEIRDHLASCGARLVAEEGGDERRRSLSDEALARIRVLERLLKHARSHFYLSPKEVWVQKQLLTESSWPEVEERLRSAGLLANTQINKSGPAEVFWRFTAPPDVIWRARAVPEAATPTLRAFWESIQA